MQSARNVAIITGMYDSWTRRYLSHCLADAFLEDASLAGAWTEDGLIGRAAASLRPRPPWLRKLAGDVLAFYHRAPADRPRELARFIELALAELGREEELPLPAVHRWPVAERAMGRARWPVPVIASTGELADFLGCDHGQLAWLADARGLERTVGAEQLRHYRYSGRERSGRPLRVIEQPKQQLKAIQRRILREILDQIPAHDAAHGFTRGRSVLTHASEHAGAYVVIRLDLTDFFPSVAAGRIYGIFRAAGYPEPVAHALTALTTNVVPATFWHSLPRPSDPAQIQAHHRLGRQLATPHLPQGAPTSPALANLAAFRLDRRLRGLAAAFGATYSRYADDLTFSGPRSLAGTAGRFRQAVAEIACEEGFRINAMKSTLATSAGRQRVCGVVVNQRPNVPRRDYEVLKAIVHNARSQGPAAQNRASLPDFRAHLLGRIAWVESLNPGHGAKLRREFDRIAWP